MVETGESLVKAALMKSGVTGKGRQPDSFDSINALADLNDMIAQWNVQRFIIWNLLDKGITWGAFDTCTVGPGGDIDISLAPRNVKAAYVRQLTAGAGSGLMVNQPLEVIPSREEYSRLSLPQLRSYPVYVYYDPSYPKGVLRPYPIPTANLYEIHIIVQNPIDVIALATDLSILPPYYIPAFKFNLAQILRQGYGRGGKPDTMLDRLAANALDVVINANLQISELVMPRSLITQSSGYNILNDQFGNG